MKNIAFLITGIVFGIILSKSEAISWFRIYEMFRFESFHMYGIMGVAVILGILGFVILKQWGIRTMEGKPFRYTKDIPLNLRRHLWAGTLFGLGWGLVGACPGPIYILIGHGSSIIFVVLLGALSGTIVYGMAKPRLPH